MRGPDAFWEHVSMTENTPSQPGYYQPQPMLESDARNMSLLAHLLVFVGGFVAPLVIWLIYRERSALVDHHGKEQLNFQISLTIITVALYVLTFITVGFGALLTVPAMFGLWIYALVIIIMAAVAASRGEYYRIPLNIRFIS